MASIVGGLIASFAYAQQPGAPDFSASVPEELRGPFVSEPKVLQRLECPTEECDGPLSFTRLIQARQSNAKAGPGGNGKQTVSQKVLNDQAKKKKCEEPPDVSTLDADNPFMLRVSREILVNVWCDLHDLRFAAEATEDRQLSQRFLIDEGSRVELVGIVNRMDRQFIKDTRLTEEQRTCGEISLIYRFSYSIRDGKQTSRLPVTLNLVFPALPADTKGGKVTCQMIADRWVKETERSPNREPAQIVADLTNPADGPLAFIDGKEIDRVELNMQAYRKGAQADSKGPNKTDFGTKAEYLILVFRWDKKLELFTRSYMGNQIDRSKVICGGKDKAACDQRRQALVKFLQTPGAVSSIDAGTLDVPFDLGVLATKASSMSPGGMHRSANQPYWKVPKDVVDREVMSDGEIRIAMDNAKKEGRKFSYMQTVDDFRTRLNEGTCTGCHQTRAIAGFHFPGEDRAHTDNVNAVLLPGSPHFYGDQPRRMRILRQMASRPDAKLTEAELGRGYSARPLKSFAKLLEKTQLIGGWGGACLIPELSKGSQRNWDCQKDLECTQLFQSPNDPAIGTCVPKATQRQIGDALQIGEVITSGFGKDVYNRKSPFDPDNLIPKSALPPNPPKDNTYYGSHQEFHEGDEDSDDHEIRRDAQTGGFPAGMLRLSECIRLPDEASCGLIASSGFNKCVQRLAKDPELKLDACFRHFTSYAGIRACNAANPCRDDYICVKPMGYTLANAKKKFEDREKKLKTSGFFHDITGRDYDATDFGQKMPDADWLKRNDQRGLCIPPYFVFQFRSDGHPPPPEKKK